ncbi:sensory neuron membrane protein 2-like isoform X1 [Anthonomus grandis grandis]|uniref:sensory neuron membrane protein 2-like isoform X1 n=1 Tax=Anthonomus grandis grandis TaxID=2921223 RepID=UPI00216559E4|nr:sensory neuron membrane protein 2-like isoform X1 [Anthonomus grandis grandis]
MSENMLRESSAELNESENDEEYFYSSEDQIERLEKKEKQNCCRTWLKCLSLTSIILSLLALIVVAIIGFAILPYIWGYRSWEYKLMKYGKIWQHFMNPENPTVVKIFIYQVDNYKKFYKNTTGHPSVYTRGPFVYRKHRSILTANINQEKDTVTYKARTRYVFDDSRSNMSQNYKINTFNVPLLIILSLNSTRPKGQTSADGIFRDMEAFGSEQSLVLENGISVRDFLFEGQPFCFPTENIHARAMCNMVRSELVSKSHNSFFRIGGENTLLFSVLGSKHNSDEGEISLCLGSKSFTKKDTGFIKAINLKQELNAWLSYPDSTCNKIDGFYSFFPAVTKFYEEFYIFIPELCSKFKFVRVKNYTRYTRYEVDINSLIGNEKGYQCHGTGTVKDIDDIYRLQLKRGATDLTKCLEGYPFISTPPYFGLPDEYREQSFLVEKDIMDNQKWYLEIDYLNDTGVCIKMVVKIQYNLFIRHEEGIEVFQNLKKTVIVPIFWYEESLTYTYEQFEESAQTMSDIYEKRADQLNLARYIAIGICIFIVLLGCCMFLIHLCCNHCSL